MSDYMNEAKEALPSKEAVAEGISNAANSAKENLQSTMNDFSSKNVMNAGSDFLAANSMIAKFMFIVLVLIVFLILLNVGMYLVYWFTTPNTSPYIIKGMLTGTSYYPPVSQDPGGSNPIVVYRSNNQSTGIEFTWSTWVKLDQVKTANGSQRYYNIFVKGNSDFDGTGVATVNNGPGLYVTSATEAAAGNTAQLHFIMDVVSPNGGSQTSQQTMDIPNVPVGKWIHVAIRLQNKVLDCYVNGVITTRLSLGDYIPKQNYDNIILCGNGGFSGAVSNLRYYDYALSVFEINSVVYYGPNLNAVSTSGAGFYDYLGQIWYNNNSTATYTGSNV
jgi:hypothetical protein